VLLSTNGSGFPADDVTNCTPPTSDKFPDDNMTMETKRKGGVLLHIFITIYAFGALAVVCNYYFLSAMEAICLSKWPMMLLESKFTSPEKFSFDADGSGCGFRPVRKICPTTCM
jgi:hypothetical protein